MNPTTMIGNNNIILTMNPDEARLIVCSLEDTMKGWVEAYDRLVDDARHAMLEGDEVIVHECLEQLDTLVNNWKAQREMITCINRILKDRANSSRCTTGSCKCSNGCDDPIPF